MAALALTLALAAPGGGMPALAEQPAAPSAAQPTPTPAAASSPQACWDATAFPAMIQTCTAVVDDLALDAKMRLRARSMRAYAHMRLRAFKAGLADANAVITAMPRNDFALATRAVILGSQGRHQQALADYDRLRVLKPRSFRFAYNRARTLVALQRNRDAVAAYADTLKLKPDFAVAYNDRCVAHRRLKAFALAKADCEAAIKLKPRQLDAYRNLAAQYLDQKRYDEAVSAWRQATEVFGAPLITALRVKLIKAELLKGQPQGAFDATVEAALKACFKVDC
ncbi:MAG: tetratricopeptide repeat protein [Pseudomonadota bacterium]